MSTLIFIPCCVCLVCGTPDLPAGSVVDLVWESIRLERQQDSLEALGLRWDLFYHALSLPHLLDSTKVKGHIKTAEPRVKNKPC